MENIFTTENLKQLYKMAEQYCIARYGFEPENIRIDDNGSLYCSDTDRDGWIQNSENIAPEVLTTDLIEAANQRTAKLEALRKEQEEKRKIEAAKQAEKELRDRRNLYEMLKKEFESK
jgi:hypothetical protein